jgi:hypothetical protein
LNFKNSSFFKFRPEILTSETSFSPFLFAFEAELGKFDALFRGA